ncbi:hypothetical protein [Solimonas fluminis]|uniref:hypothetical protein n=1 Tax=Solimonas fluminis TaxID=2086571 RepID=UPI0010573D89|nr:hypothetical protein [Solimonas fluminis]
MKFNISMGTLSRRAQAVPANDTMTFSLITDKRATDGVHTAAWMRGAFAPRSAAAPAKTPDAAS